MHQSGLFLSIMITVSTFVPSVNAAAPWAIQDPYPEREELQLMAKSLCLQLSEKSPTPPVTEDLLALLRTHLRFEGAATAISKDAQGWTADLHWDSQPGGFLRLQKNGANFNMNYRQKEKDIEAIASVSFDGRCDLNGARYTFFNVSLRPIKKIRINAQNAQTLSVVIEEPVENPPQKKQVAGPPVRIGVIDSGLDYNHPALMAKSRPMLGIDLTDPDRPPYDYMNTIQNELMGQHFSHGSAVADIAVRNLNALIVPVRIENQLKLAGAAAEYLAKEEVRIINVSQGSERKEEWLPFLQAMKNHPEILFIVAAGNEAQDIDVKPSYPASFNLPNMLVVASIGSAGSLSSFSNYGPRHVHFAALGENISAAKAGGGQWTVNGTSFAAPLVARIAARILLENPALNSRELRSRLIQKARTMPGLTGKIQYGILAELSPTLAEKTY